MAKRNFVVLHCDSSTNFIQCVGVHDDWQSACGNAVLWLTDRIDDMKNEDTHASHTPSTRNYSLSPMYRTEGETGFGIDIQIDGKPSDEYALILDNGGED